MSSKFITTVQQDANTEDCYIEIPNHILKTLNWQEGDELAWSISQGKIILTKVKDAGSTREEPTMSDYDYYTSESEGKEYKDYDEKYDNYIEETAKETFGQYYHSPEAQGGWYAIKAEAIKKYGN